MAYDHPSHRVHDLRGRQVHAFHVEPGQLDTGTETNQGTRDYSNGRVEGAPAPAAQWDARWGVGGQSGAGSFQNTAPADGGVWHAGHLLARQNGGLGNVNAGVLPQNPQYNSGVRLDGERTFDSWRGQEQQFHDQVQQQQVAGDWTAAVYDAPYVAPDPAAHPYDPDYFALAVGTRPPVVLVHLPPGFGHVLWAECHRRWPTRGWRHGLVWLWFHLGEVGQVFRLQLYSE